MSGKTLRDTVARALDEAAGFPSIAFMHDRNPSTPVIDALRAEDRARAYRLADAAIRLIVDECAKVAETEYCSTVTLATRGSSVRPGPFSVQDEAARTTSESIAKAIRSLAEKAVTRETDYPRNSQDQ